MNQRMKWDAEAAFKRIERHAENKPKFVECGRTFGKSDRPYTPPPNVAAWLKAQADKPKPHGRDYEALRRAAFEPGSTPEHPIPKREVGYWEDAPRGMKFGGSGGKPTTASQKAAQTTPQGPAREPSAAPTTTPPAADDEFEPVGTKVQIGDRITARIDMGWADGIGAFTVAYINENGVFGSDANPRITSQDYMDAGKRRILKRPTKPRDDVATGARVWADEGFAWVQVGGTVYSRVSGGRFVEGIAGRTSDLKPEWELHGPERDAIVAECRKAMGI